MGGRVMFRTAFLVAIQFIMFPDGIKTLCNMGLLGTPTQKSEQTSPLFAIDGDRRTSMSNPPYCASTSMQMSPFWRVKFDRDFSISKIEIVNTNESTFEAANLKNLEIRVGYEGSTTLCDTYAGPGGMGEIVVINCTPSVDGNFVEIQSTVYTRLTLCEVEVWAERLISGGSNQERLQSVENKRNSASPVQDSVSAHSEIECASKCATKPDCLSFNVKPQVDGKVTCELLRECPKLGSNLVDAPGWKYIALGDMSV